MTTKNFNVFSMRTIPLVLILALLLPSEITGRVGEAGSLQQHQEVEIDIEHGGLDVDHYNRRHLGGGYGKQPARNPGKHNGNYYKPPRHNGRYYYVTRPVDPSEYYHNLKPVAHPTPHAHSDPHPEPTLPTRMPTYRPTESPKTDNPTTKRPTLNIPISMAGTPKPIDIETGAPTPTPIPTPEPTKEKVPGPPTLNPAAAFEIVVIRDEENDEDKLQGTLNPMNGEVMSIILDPPAKIQARIQDFVLQGGAEFDDPNSYQSAALRRVQEQVGAEGMSDIKLLQYYILYSVFESTNSKSNDFIVSSRAFDDGIPRWKITDGWMETDLDPCGGKWYGVSCENDKVVNLDLFDNGLTGNFAPEVVLLASDGFYATGAGSLVSLDIFNNEMMSNNGDNSWIQDLGSQLGYLYLQNTMFSGKLPPKFPEGLVELDIANSMITGELLGAAFENLSSLRFLLMDGVQFDSTIPSEIARLPNLEYLFATDAMITGDLSYMESMSVIFEHWVDRNPGLGGTIPEFLGDLTTLQSFSIAECSFTGTIPESLGNLAMMQQLWLYGNELSGEIPASLGNLSFMRIFEVEGNNLSDSMPQSVCDNFSTGMLEVLGGDCDKLECPCCTCCSMEECRA